ncbi:MAG: phospho-sugar mutase [Crocinitomicaceae bacterium]|nr:phospho-sugar mutase [Crocinitomicaceae bacterium]
MSTTTELPAEIVAKANGWLSPLFDESTRTEVSRMLAGDPKELMEAFHADLEFGTGGLRGIMGVGSCRMNRYTVGMTTQGLANYLKKLFPGKQVSVAIAHDSRNNSRFFTETAAAVFSANGIAVNIFSELRPTPLLSFTVRHLKCQAGIVITASHNPPEYNGYKVYWEDGSQVVAPHDIGIIEEVRAVKGPQEVFFDANPSLITVLDESTENIYLEKIGTLLHAQQEIISSQPVFVYTPIHGSGITLVPKALKKFGFTNVHIVEEQSVPNGNFPTVKSPNPEEKDAMKMALDLAQKVRADVVVGTDPDSDRVGLAVPDEKGNYLLLNGNQTLSLLVYYQLCRWSEKGLLTGNQFVVKTVVTSELVADIARSFKVEYFDTLTGFKYMADVIRRLEGKRQFICGGEESFGCLIGDFVRDKDGVISTVVMGEMAAWAKSNNTSLWGIMLEIYQRYGVYHEQLLSITMKGLDGSKQIQAMMVRMRDNPPTELAGSKVKIIRDFKTGVCRNIFTAEETAIDLPSSNVLQFELEDGSMINARPSGTEPKIKFYFSMKAPFRGAGAYTEQVKELEVRMDRVKKELGL